MIIEGIKIITPKFYSNPKLPVIKRKSRFTYVDSSRFQVLS